MEYRNVKKILIFKLCCFGDTVFMTPAIQSLKRAFPEAEIYYAYSKWVEPMMKYIPDIDGSILFENVYDTSVLNKISSALKFIKRIRSENFDMVLNGHRSNLLAFILSLCGIRYRLGFEGTKFLTHTAPFNDRIKEYLRYLNILDKNGIKYINTVPKLIKPETDSLRSNNGILPDEKVIGIFPNAGNNPGTQMDIKKWELEKFFDLARLINARLPEIKIIIFEGKSLNEKFKLPSDISAVKREIDNDLLACCSLFVSGDTGSLHIAAAFGVSTVSIFGPTDPILLAPVNPADPGIKHRFIWNKPLCAPCYTPLTAIKRNNHRYWKDNNFICHTGTNECMKSVMPLQVFDAIEALLEYSESVKYRLN